MKVSVITVTIDSDRVLKATVESVSAQTYPDIEHIIVDGIGERFSGGITSTYHLEPNGVYDALNFGISHANGDIIGILHGGDRFASTEIIEKVAEAFNADPSLDFIFGDIRFYNQSTGKPGRIYHAGRFTPRHLTYGMAPPHPSLYIRRQAAGRIGPYRTDFRLAADLDMWMRLFADTSLKSKYIPEIFVEMSSGGASTSLRNRLFANNREKLKALRLNGFSPNPLRLLAKYFFVLRDAFSDLRIDSK